MIGKTDIVEKIKVGDVVRLRSGSQIATVGSISTRGVARIIYSNYSTGQLLKYNVPLIVLEKKQNVTKWP